MLRQEIRFLLLNSRNVILSRLPRCNSANQERSISVSLPVCDAGHSVSTRYEARLPNQRVRNEDRSEDLVPTGCSFEQPFLVRARVADQVAGKKPLSYLPVRLVGSDIDVGELAGRKLGG